MFKRLITAALVFGTAALAPPLALAQGMICMPRADLVAGLEHKHGEKLVGAGLQSAGQMVEIWSSDASGSFTVLFTRADGLSCIVAAGQNWHNIAKSPPEGVAG